MEVTGTRAWQYYNFTLGDNSTIIAITDFNSISIFSTLYEYEKNLAVQSYKVLKECDIAIEKACNISLLEGYDKVWRVFINTTF